MLVEYRRKEDNRSYLADPTRMALDSTFGRSTALRLPFYAAIRLTAEQFRGLDSKVVVVGQQEYDHDKIDVSSYLNPLLVCGYDYRFGVAAQLRRRPDASDAAFAYVPMSRSIIRELP